jgi:hypothetical protein
MVNNEPYIAKEANRGSMWWTLSLSLFRSWVRFTHRRTISTKCRCRSQHTVARGCVDHGAVIATPATLLGLLSEVV